MTAKVEHDFFVLAGVDKLPDDADVSVAGAVQQQLFHLHMGSETPCGAAAYSGSTGRRQAKVTDIDNRHCSGSEPVNPQKIKIHIRRSHVIIQLMPDHAQTPHTCGAERRHLLTCPSGSIWLAFASILLFC